MLVVTCQIFNWKTNGNNKFCSDYQNETKIQPGEKLLRHKCKKTNPNKPSTASWEKTMSNKTDVTHTGRIGENIKLLLSLVAGAKKKKQAEIEGNLLLVTIHPKPPQDFHKLK